MDEAESEEIREHLTTCPICADAVLLFRDMREHPLEESHLDFDPVKAWADHQKLRNKAAFDHEKARSDARSEALGRSPQTPEERLIPLWRRPWFAYAFAAAVVTVSLLFWRNPEPGKFDAAPNRLPAIEANPKVVTLTSLGEGTRSDKRSESLDPGLPLVLFLPVVSAGEYGVYDLQIINSQGETVLENGRLKPDDLGIFAIFLRSGSLGSGDYHIHLFGVERGKRELLEKFPLRLYPPSSEKKRQ